MERDVPVALIGTRANKPTRRDVEFHLPGEARESAEQADCAGCDFRVLSFSALLSPVVREVERDVAVALIGRASQQTNSTGTSSSTLPAEARESAERAATAGFESAQELAMSRREHRPNFLT